MEKDCDFSIIKDSLKEGIHEVIQSLQDNLEVFDQEEICVLEDLERVKNDVERIKRKASHYYLNCYLSPYTDMHSQLTTSVQNMSQRRHGGLIVVERKEAIDHLVQPGITIDAKLTHSLMESIFYPGNPLHDGAVVVKQNMILSAANILPLSSHTANDQLGTRHRAAIGLSEQSDALVLIVSEETGRVSFTLNGTLYSMSE